MFRVVGHPSAASAALVASLNSKLAEQEQAAWGQSSTHVLGDRTTVLGGPKSRKRQQPRRLNQLTSAPSSPRDSPEPVASPFRHKFQPNVEVLNHSASDSTLHTLRSNFQSKRAIFSDDESAAPSPTPVDTNIAAVMDMKAPDAFPTSAESKTIAAAISSWLCGMGDFSSQYNSACLFLEVKLTEMEALAGRKGIPNPVRTAVAFGLLDLIFQRVSMVRSVVGPLRTELLRSVYTRESLDASGVLGLSGRIPTQRMLELLLGCNPYFDEAQKAQNDLAAERQAGETELEEQYKEAKAIAHYEKKKALKDLLLKAKVFYALKLSRTESITKKQMVAARAVGRIVQGVSKRDVFMAWRFAVLKSRLEAASAAQVQNNDQIETAHAALQAAHQTHQQLSFQLANAQEQVHFVTQQFAQFQEHAQAELKKQREVIGSLVSVVEASCESCIELLSDGVNEVQHTVDATWLEEALTLKDVHPELCGNAPYQYGGTGEVVGGADYSDVDPTYVSEASKEAEAADVVELTVAPFDAELEATLGLNSPNGAAGELSPAPAATEEGGSKKPKKSAMKKRNSVVAPLASPKPRKSISFPGGSEMVAVDSMSSQTCVPNKPARFSVEAVSAALRRLPTDMIVMRWVNYHLCRAIVDGEAYGTRIHNFGSDVNNGRALAVLLTQVAPGLPNEMRAASCQDPATCVELAVKQLQYLYPSPQDFVTGSHLIRGTPEICYAMFARLMTTFPGTIPPAPYIKTLLTLMDASRIKWQMAKIALHGAVASVDQSLHQLSKPLVSAEEHIRSRANTPVVTARQDDELVIQVHRYEDLGLEHHVVAERRTSEIVGRMDVVAALTEFNKVLRSTRTAVATALDRSRAGHALWHETSHRAIGDIWRVFAGRLLYLPQKISDEREVRELTEYTVIFPVKYRDLLDRHCHNQKAADEEVEAMQVVLRQYRGELMRIFKYYCASGDGSSISTMTQSEYWTFLRDTKLAEGFGDKNSARLDLIFGKANQKAGLADDDENNPPNELIPREWVETLVRIGVMLNEKKQPLPTLSASLRFVLEKFVLPNATQSNTEQFRLELQSPEVREVFKKHRLPLQRVFAYYAASKPSELGVANSMNVDQFLKMLREAQLMSRTLTPLVVKQIFALTQLEEAFAEDTDAGGGEDEMVYSEFIEGVAAVALHVLPSPYVTASKRIDVFIEEHLLPAARQFKPKQRLSTKKPDGSGGGAMDNAPISARTETSET